ncbi:hypothetical protein [Stieleria varia]|uniref:hypothetical protein n=1 Tax=Stieleria varia TaxID=2528005 RepID=UPI001E2FD376|nr:hypothetical protein [Stieleria varia]
MNSDVSSLSIRAWPGGSKTDELQRSGRFSWLPSGLVPVEASTITGHLKSRWPLCHWHEASGEMGFDWPAVP